MSVTLLTKWLMLSAIAKDPRITPAGVEVALCLLNHHNNKTEQCNPSYATIAEWTGLNRDTVFNCIRTLASADYLKIEGALEAGKEAVRGQRLPSNTYKFKFERADQPNNPTTSRRKFRLSRSEIPNTPDGYSEHPPSDIPISGSRKSRPKHGNLENGNLETGKRTREQSAHGLPLKRIADRQQFDEFFRQSPKQTKLEPAWLEYRRLIRQGQVTHEALMVGIMQAAAEHRRSRTEDRYFPSPVQWLRDGRWNDRPVKSDVRPSASDGIRSFLKGESISDLMSRTSSPRGDDFLELEANREAE